MKGEITMRKMISLLVFALLFLGESGCSAPDRPNLFGPGKLQDITQVRKGMSPNEVERVMGSKHKSVFEEGLQGMDGGNYIWEYASGRVYFGTDGVTRVQRY
jgi:hypothetical protein